MSKQVNGRKKDSPLSIFERTVIEVRYRDGNSLRSIGRQLGRDASTVSREIAGKPSRGIGKYIARVAHAKALDRIGKRGNIAKLDKSNSLKQFVVCKLKLGWSPEQISIRLPIEYPDESDMRVSHEAIYRYVYSQIYRFGNGMVKPGCCDLRVYLTRRHKRRAKKGFRKAQRELRQGSLPSINCRPSVVGERSRIGDWEDDLLVSKKSKVCIKSVNERKSGIVFFGKTRDGKAVSGDRVLFDKLHSIPRKYLKTLTRDRGSENKNFKKVQEGLGLKVYFANAYCSYERGSNENANGLLRRYFPKGTDFGKITDRQISEAEYLINTRPRKRFSGLTPAEVFYQETGVALFC